MAGNVLCQKMTILFVLSWRRMPELFVMLNCSHSKRWRSRDPVNPFKHPQPWPVLRAAGGRRRMKFLLAHAASGSRLRLDAAESSGNDGLTIAICQRGSAAMARAGTLALWCPVRGDARVVAGDCNVQLSRGDIFVTDAHGSHEVTVSGHGICIGIVGTPQAWSAIGRGRPGESSAMALFPAVHRDKTALCRQFLRFARLCVADRDGFGGGHRAHVLAALVDELQSGFREMIARCPGSSLSRKNAVFLRLQRVRSYITACAHRD